VEKAVGTPLRQDYARYSWSDSQRSRPGVRVHPNGRAFEAAGEVVAIFGDARDHSAAAHRLARLAIHHVVGGVDGVEDGEGRVRFPVLRRYRNILPLGAGAVDVGAKPLC
jgi:hypothetical protein